MLRLPSLGVLHALVTSAQLGGQPLGRDAPAASPGLPQLGDGLVETVLGSSGPSLSLKTSI